jgi:fatty-acyl-CoA synthase
MKPIRNKHYDVWPKRLPRSVSPPETTLWANLEISYRRFARRHAFIFFDRSITFANLFAEVEALAGWLHCVAGVRAGDRVAVLRRASL